MKIGIIGVGVVGGATGQVLGRQHEVYLYDKYEGPSSSFDKIRDIAKNVEVVFICVPTPINDEGEMDDSFLIDALDLLEQEVKSVGRDPNDILAVIRSTAICGTSDSLAERYRFKFASNPEFLTERRALEDMENTNRVVIGANDIETREKLASVYKPLFPNAAYILVNRRTAEMIKYCANVMLAGQVGLANEICQICEHLGVDYNSIREAISHDDLIGKNIRVPGTDGDLGFGGKCLPKDFNTFISLAKKNGYDPKLLEEIWELNLRVRKNKDWLEIVGATSTLKIKTSKGTKDVT